MMYCESCGRTGAKREDCPVCASRKYRPVRPEDFCFLRETPALQDGLLEEVLKQEKIAYFKRPVLGAVMAATVGRLRERYRFYVRYDHFAVAQDIAYSLLGGEPPENAGER